MSDLVDLSWDLACKACETDDTTLIAQALSALPKQKDPDALIQSSLWEAINNNATNVLKYLVEHGAQAWALRPLSVTGATKETIEILLAHGWDINTRVVSTSGGDTEPFMWHIVRDEDLVVWCLEHGAYVVPTNQKPLRNDEITSCQRSCRQVLERAAARGSIATFKLLSSKGAPLGWRTLHFAAEGAAISLATRAEDAEARLDMVRYLIDVVGLDVNALDRPAGRRLGGYWGTPICYVAEIAAVKHSIRDITWLLLDRGADPAPALKQAVSPDYEVFAADVEAWKVEGRSASQQGGSSKCIVQ
jgi:hypothetical protein